MSAASKLTSALIAILFGAAGFWLARTQHGAKPQPHSRNKTPAAAGSVSATAPVPNSSTKPPVSASGTMFVTLDDVKSLQGRFETITSEDNDIVRISPKIAGLFGLTGDEMKLLHERLTRMKRECNKLDVANRRVITQTEDKTEIEVAPYAEQATAMWTELRQELSDRLGDARSEAILALLEEDRDKLTFGFGQFKKEVSISVSSGFVWTRIGAGPHGDFSQASEGLQHEPIPKNLRHLLHTESVPDSPRNGAPAPH